MANGKIRIIAAKEIETDILAEEEVPSVRGAEELYLDGLRRLVKGKRATFAGRALDEDTGVAYQLYQLPKDGEEKPTTVFIEDRPATTLLDNAGNIRRLRVRT